MITSSSDILDVVVGVVIVVVVVVVARVGCIFESVVGVIVSVGVVCSMFVLKVLVASDTIPSNTGLTKSLFDIRN